MRQKKPLCLLKEADLKLNVNMDAIIQKYNYKLETGTVGTDNENIANILYNINRMETNVPYPFSDIEETEEDLGELFFMIVDAKVHISRFANAFADKIETDTVDTVVAALDDAMQIVRDAMDQTDTAKMSATFSEVYKKLLGIVPAVLTLDAQSVGRI